MYELSEETKNSLNKFYLDTFGMSYQEFSMLDFDEQERLVSEYNKTHPKEKSEYSKVAFGTGDNLIFVSYPTGERVLTSNGYVIAGETIEEEKHRRERELYGSISGLSNLKQVLLELKQGNNDPIVRLFHTKSNDEANWANWRLDWDKWEEEKKGKSKRRK